MINKPLNLLIVEDSEDDAELMLRELRRSGFAPEWKRVETEPGRCQELHPEIGGDRARRERDQSAGGAQTVFTNRVSEVLFQRFVDNKLGANNSERLSTREQEIVRLLAEGKTNKEIGDVLVVSVRTVETHRANITAKPGFGSLAELVRYAVRHGMIEP